MVTRPGIPLPLGAHLQQSGINFSLFSRHACRITLLLFDSPTDAIPSQTTALDIKQNKTGDIWHIWVEGVGSGCLYAWQVDGPDAPGLGHRFNPQKILLDPYASALAGTECWDFSCLGGDLSAATSDAGAKAKCLVVESCFDWQGDQPLRHAWSDTIIYETHLRGLTVHSSSAVEHPGTFRGLVEKIPYFQALSITAIELLPVQEFFENDLDLHNPVTGERLQNYWGYSTVAFFSAKEGYASCKQLGSQLSEFKTMVRELHRAGIEVILDIVFNHTAEGNHLGPTLNFKGLDNSIYYLLEDDRHFYKNYSGTGNTLNCNHPVVRDYILDCLRHWVIEMHIDGFRFDLASVLGRDAQGRLLANPPLLERIAEDPVLRDVKLIAEAWDAGGAYQVGSFPGQRWSEWNGHFRDDVRRFWRGDAGLAGALASRIAGSADIYQHTGKKPVNSINFITSHDGFTLNDLVSYRDKHNEANGENNADGDNNNYSDNYGIEGSTDDPAIEALRLRQIKNFIATLMISRGVPMLLGGDEFRRTQGGNNNAYCQDNEVSWFDWELAEHNAGLLRFCRKLIALRKRHPALGKDCFYDAEDITWFDPGGSYPDWRNEANTLGCIIHGRRFDDVELCLLFNAEAYAVEFRLPSSETAKRWRLAVSTAEPTPNDVRSPRDYKLCRQSRLTLMDHALAILVR